MRAQTRTPSGASVVAGQQQPIPRPGRSATLADFIRGNHAVIVKEWETFAATLRPAAEDMNRAGLRDHADEILTAVVADMEEPQASAEQTEKSKGRGREHRMETVGGVHAALRVENGFKLDQLVAEYRALRGSVLRLWGRGGVCDVEQVTRFNEAIDEALTEATTRYSSMIEQTRDQFLGILSHDLRNPLTGIMLSAAQIGKATGPDQVRSRAAALRITNSAGRMDRMVNDLLDLTRTRLGGGIPITKAAMDLESLVREVLGEFETSGGELRYEAQGDLRGDWDRDRIAQVISNLVGNALQHGEANTPVQVAAQGLEKEVLIEVQNTGSPISAERLATVFDPMVRHGEDHSKSKNLGLGLFIAREIVTAHGGVIAVTSTQQEGTKFTVRLPRHS